MQNGVTVDVVQLQLGFYVDAILDSLFVVRLILVPPKQRPVGIGVEVLAVAREPPHPLLTPVVQAHEQVPVRLRHQVFDRPGMFCYVTVSLNELVVKVY